MDAAATIRAAGVQAAPPRPTVPAARLASAARQDPAAAAAAARDFEAMFISQMLEPMFSTVDTAHGLFGGGAGEEAWKPMLVDAVAKQMAAAGGFGLAATIEREMLRMQEGKQA